MTQDFLDDFTEACEREKIPFLVIVGSHQGQSAQVRMDLEHWHPAGPTPKTNKQDILQLLDCIDWDERSNNPPPP